MRVWNSIPKNNLICGFRLCRAGKSRHTRQQTDKYSLFHHAFFEFKIFRYMRVTKIKRIPIRFSHRKAVYLPEHNKCFNEYG